MIRKWKRLKSETNDISQSIEAVAEQQLEQNVQVESETSDIPEFHIVDRGENLYRISLLYSIKMQRLVDWFNLVDASAIFGVKIYFSCPKR